jgi:hypothetical protein
MVEDMRGEKQQEVSKEKAIPGVAKVYLEGIRSDRVKKLGLFMEKFQLQTAADNITGLGGKKYTHVQNSRGDIFPVIGGDGEVENKVIMTVEELERLSE